MLLRDQTLSKISHCCPLKQGLRLAFCLFFFFVLFLFSDKVSLIHKGENKTINFTGQG